jgi:hypothetical protein
MSTASRKTGRRTSSAKGPVRPRKAGKTPAAICDNQICTGEAIAFCQEHGIASLLERALELAQKHFTPNSLSVYLSGDPDGDGQWVVVRADLSGTVDMALSAYRNLKTEWLESVGWEQNSAIRFLYNIL